MYSIPFPGLNLKAYEQLVLTLQWDRADIARSDIFVLGQEWPRGALEQSMMEALMLTGYGRITVVHRFNSV